jgi:ParB-like chromosome segregation protein Spo0J
MTTAVYVTTEEIDLDALTPFPGNAWQGDPEKIAESIRANGQYRSMVVRRTGEGDVVLAGNHTRLALKHLGRSSGRCEVIVCDADTAVRINLADNKIPTYGSYDDNALLELLKVVADDMTGTGYDPDELDDLLAALTPDVTVLPEVGPTDARYAESDEEEQARRDRVEAYEPRHGGGDGDGAMTELILVMTVADRTEAAELIKTVRERDGDLTAGQIVLYALRVHAADDGPEEGDEDA